MNIENSDKQESVKKKNKNDQLDTWFHYFYSFRSF